MQLIAAVVSALALALALPNEFAPYGIAPLGFICLAPYFAALGKAGSYRKAALLGTAFGMVSHAASSYWLYFFKDFAVWTIGSTTIAYGMLHALVAGFLHRVLKDGSGPVRMALFRSSFDPSVLRPFLAAMIWTVWEWRKSIGFLGYPWGLVAYGVNDYPRMIQIADGLGVYGLSFLLSLSSALIAETVRVLGQSAATLRGNKILAALRPWGIGAALFLWFSAYGAYRLEHPTATVDAVPMLLVQHNGDSWIHGELGTLESALRLSREGIAGYRPRVPPLLAAREPQVHDKPALIVWSETVLRRPFLDYLPFFRTNPPGGPLVPFLEEAGIPLLTGAPIVLDYETYEATNSAILIESDASVPYSYAKQHPVPFAEAIPFWEYQWMRDFMSRMVGLEGGWTMGTEATVMEIPTPSGRPLRFGVPICFEDAFADVCADFIREGADLWVNITNDSWSKTISAETQHFAAARFRTVENRRVMVRATNGGVTSVIDAEGRMIASLPLFEEAQLPVLVPVQIASGPTAYQTLGDWFPAFCALCLLGFLVLDRSLGLQQPCQPGEQ